MRHVMEILGIVMESLVFGSKCKMYPVKPAKFFDATRGHVEIETGKCILCSLCAKKCPTDAITVERQNKIWKIDRMKCIACALCVDACPKKCLKMANSYSPVGTSRVNEEVFNIAPPAKSPPPAQ